MGVKESKPKNIILEADKFDFQKVLEPYKEAGTREERTERTWGKIVIWLSGKHGVPIKTIGAAILITAVQLEGGKKFDGDGSFGSKGRQLDQYIKDLAFRIQGAKEEDAIYASIAKQIIRGAMKDLKIRRDLLKLVSKIDTKLEPWWKLWR